MIVIMKTIKIIAFSIGITTLATVAAVSGLSVQIIVPVPVVTPPPVVVAPAPAVTVEVGVPDSYAWDGYEYIGVVGTQYYYLGPGNVWVVMDPVRLARFHDWEKIHADWRTHATANVRYRVDAHGHTVPLHSDKDTSHDQSH